MPGGIAPFLPGPAHPPVKLHSRFGECSRVVHDVIHASLHPHQPIIGTTSSFRRPRDVHMGLLATGDTLRPRRFKPPRRDAKGNCRDSRNCHSCRSCLNPRRTARAAAGPTHRLHTPSRLTVRRAASGRRFRNGSSFAGWQVGCSRFLAVGCGFGAHEARHIPFFLRLVVASPRGARPQKLPSATLPHHPIKAWTHPSAATSSRRASASTTLARAASR